MILFFYAALDNETKQSAFRCGFIKFITFYIKATH